MVSLSVTIRFATQRSLHLRLGACVSKVGKSLGGHQGDGAGAGADIQESAVGRGERHGSAEQYAISIDLHGAALIDDFEFLETEYTHTTVIINSLICSNLDNNRWGSPHQLSPKTLSVNDLIKSDKLSVYHVERSVAHLREVRIVSYDYDGLAVFVAKVEEQLMKFLLGLAVKVS